MTAPLPVCSAIFQRRICPHSQLFAKEYTRSNRSRGNKILRCFPHCCPYHVDRSYCGSPLEVLVQFASPLDASLPTGQADQDRSPPFDLANAFVFARFESENDDALSGGPHSLRDLRSASQRNEEAGPVWIEGIRSLQSHGSRTPGSSMSSTFTLNGEPFDKWHHHWESGANRSQRSTRHALKAYVFYVRSDRQHSSEHFEQSFGVQQEQIMDAALEQLCVVSSPLFTVTSYRRSSSNAPATSVDTATVQQPGEMETAALRVHHFEMNESRREERHQLAHEAYQVRPPRYQEHRRQALPPPEDQEEEEVARRSNQSFSGSHQDRQAHQREEGLDLLLLSPEEAAQSAPFLHSLIQSCEPRLVFARKRHRAGSYQRRGDATRRGCGYRAADGRGDVERQGPTLHHESRSKTYEGTPATRPVGTPSSFLWPVRTTAREARNAPQRALGAALHQLSDLAVIHLVASRVTAISARRGSSTLPEVLAVAIAEFWRCGRGEAQQLAQLVFAAAGGGGDANATSVRGRSESSSSEEALSALARVTIWTASPANLEWMQSLLAACSPGVRSSSVGSSAGAAEDEDNELRSAFFKCVGRCWVRLDEFLQIHRATHPTIRSVRDLSDAMLGFVYCDPALEALRPELRAVLQTCAAFYESSIGNARGSHGHDGDGSLVLWRHFVAKARESYMTSRSPRCGFPAQSASSSWTDEWVLQPDSLAVVSPGGGHLVAATHSVHEETVPSLWTSCCTIAQLLRVKLAVAGESLYLVPLNVARDVDQGWVELVCDGRVRPAAYSAAPDLGPGCFGDDYVAYRLEQAPRDVASSVGGAGQPDLDPICLELYWWSRGRTQARAPLAAFRAVVTLTIGENCALIDGQVCLERGFVEHGVLTAAPTLPLESWSPEERVDAVAYWKPWLLVHGTYTRS